MKKVLIILLVSFGFASCGYDLSTGNNTIELSNTYGINVEAVFNTPDFILNHKITFEEIVIIYTVRKNDAFAANVKVYVSADQTADNVELPNDEEVLNVTLGISENSKSGTVSSILVKTILNSKQPKFVIGAENLSVSPISSVFIDLDVQMKGTWSL